MCAFQTLHRSSLSFCLNLIYCLAVIFYLPHFVICPHYHSVLSPQIYIIIFNQGLRFLCLLTCSFLSQVKHHPSLSSQPQSFIDFLSFLLVWYLSVLFSFSRYILFLFMHWHRNFSVAEACSWISKGFNYINCFCFQISTRTREEIPKRRLYDTEERLWVEPA